MTEHTFILPGACPPKGSRTPVGRGRATREASKRVKPWTDEAVRRMLGDDGKPRAVLSGPVYVAPTFVFRRPRKTDSAFPVSPTVGDLDKLVRCALDALVKAGVIEDDRFVVQLREVTKVWGPGDATILRVGPVTIDEVRKRTVNPFSRLGPDPIEVTSDLSYHREFVPGPEPRAHFEIHQDGRVVDNMAAILDRARRGNLDLGLAPNPYAHLVNPVVERHHECMLVSIKCGEEDCPVRDQQQFD